MQNIGLFRALNKISPQLTNNKKNRNNANRYLVCFSIIQRNTVTSSEGDFKKR